MSAPARTVEAKFELERSEGGPQTARRRAGRSPKGDVGSSGAAGMYEGAAPPA